MNPERPDTPEGPGNIVVAATVPLCVTFMVTAEMTDEEIAAVAERYAAAAAKIATKAIRRARRRAGEAEAALGGTGPFGFPNGLAAAATKADDPPPIDPISARAREHPRVRAVYKNWFGGGSSREPEEE